jgi:nucleoside-diphosphate-sugar epimerase
VRILVTGTRGFVGSHLARAFAERGHRVVSVQRSGSPPEGTEPRILDLSQSFELGSGLDAVVHAAATSPQPGVGDSVLIRDNVVGTHNLVEASRRAGVRSFVFLSSLSIYGEICTAEVDEDTPRCNPGVYGATKYLGESMVASLAPSCTTFALRLPGVVGSGAARNWLSGLLATLRGGGPVAIYNPEAPFNNAVHVDDLAGLIEGLLPRTDCSDVMNLASRDALPVREVARRLAEAVGYRGEIAVRPPLQRPFTISCRRAVQHHSYAPMPLKTLLKRYATEGATELDIANVGEPSHG